MGSTIMSFVSTPAEFLPTVADGQDLDLTLMNFVDEAMPLVDQLANSGVVPLWNNSALIGEIRKCR